jgi:3-methyladenine DNA glycosylase AlkD
MRDIAQTLVKHIQANEHEEKARWLERYVQHGIASYGVGIPQLRLIVQELCTQDVRDAPLTEQTQFLHHLMQHSHIEPKLAAIVYMQLYWNDVDPATVLHLSSEWLEGALSDWNTCDWLCVRVLTPLLDKDPQLCVHTFGLWNTSRSIWKARASLVPFAQAKRISTYKDVIIAHASYLIRRDERFCKTAVGWILRVYSKIDRDMVIDFLEHHQQWLTREVVNNAKKYFP